MGNDGLTDIDFGLICALVLRGGEGTMSDILEEGTTNSIRNLCAYRLKRMEKMGLLTIKRATSARLQFLYSVNKDYVKSIKNGVLLEDSGKAYTTDDFVLVDAGDVIYLHRHSQC